MLIVESINSDGQQFHQYQQKKDHDIWYWKYRSRLGDRHKNVEGL